MKARKRAEQKCRLLIYSPVPSLRLKTGDRKRNKGGRLTLNPTQKNQLFRTCIGKKEPQKGTLTETPIEPLKKMPVRNPYRDPPKEPYKIPLKEAERDPNVETTHVGVSENGGPYFGGLKGVLRGF